MFENQEDGVEELLGIKSQRACGILGHKTNSTASTINNINQGVKITGMQQKT